jgi:hypothetical protein
MSRVHRDGLRYVQRKTGEAFGPESQVTRRRHDVSARPVIVADVPDDIVRLASYSARP